LLAVLGFFFLGLLHLEPLRRGCPQLGRAAVRGLWAVFVGLPAWLVANPVVRPVGRASAGQLLYLGVLKPARVCPLFWRLLAVAPAVGGRLRGVLAAAAGRDAALARGRDPLRGRQLGPQLPPGPGRDRGPGADPH